MNKFFKIAAALFVVLLLPACASTQKTAYGNKPPQNEAVVVDARYVALVESMAKQRGTRVMWVNTPKKRVVATADTPR